MASLQFILSKVVDTAASLLPREAVHSDKICYRMIGWVPSELEAVALKDRKTGLWDVELRDTMNGIEIPAVKVQSLAKGQTPEQVVALFDRNVTREACRPKVQSEEDYRMMVCKPGNFRVHPEFRHLSPT